MSKALTVFLVILLVLGAAALGLNIHLFSQRTSNKIRVQKLEKAVIEVTARLAEAKDPFVKTKDVAVNANDLKVGRKEEWPRMDGQLGKLKAIATDRYEELYLTKDDLKKTQDKLAETEAELAKTKQELADARDEIARLKDSIAKKEAEIDATNKKIGEAETQLAGLKTDLEKLKGEVLKKDEEIAGLNERIISLENELKVLSATLQNKPMPRGLTGKVVATNPEWHFVVLNIGRTSGVQVQGEFAVHRGDQLVGKVRVMQVDETTSLADVPRGWQLQPIQEGDSVLN